MKCLVTQEQAEIYSYQFKILVDFVSVMRSFTEQQTEDNARM